jgi:hypothetical protein
VPMKDDFAPDHPLPVFLTRPFEEPQQRASSRLLKVSLFAMAAAAIGIAITLALGDPVQLFADVMASFTGSSAARATTDQSAPPVQSTADAQAVPQTASGASNSDAVAAAPDPAGVSQADNGPPPANALLKQFQAWAVQQDAQAQAGPAQPIQNGPTQVEPVRPIQDAQPQAQPQVQPQVQAAQPVDDAPTQASDDTPAPAHPVRLHRKNHPVQNARAEVRQPKPPRAVARPPDRTAQARPAQDARPPDQPAQNAQAPSLLQSLGLSH